MASDVQAFVDRRDASDILRVDEWFPAALWLGPSTCLVRTDEGPEPDLPARLAEALSQKGLVEISPAEDLQAAVLAVAMQRVDVIAASWTIWSVDEPTARADVTAAATG